MYNDAIDRNIVIKHSVPSSVKREGRVSFFIFCAMAFVIGLAIAFAIFPLDMLFDRWSWFEKIQDKDIKHYLVSYLYLAQDKWRWPLTHTVFLNPPNGVNIFYTDPIPALALIGKIIYKTTGILIIYLGWWLLLSYGMQTLLGWLIFRQMQLRNTLALIASVLLVMPAFIFRWAHIPLAAHWIILFSILFYIRAVSVAGRRELYFSAIGIGSILGINAYLLAMSAPIFLAGVAEATRRKRISWRVAVFAGVLMLATIGTWSIVFGVFGDKGLPSSGGFGHYSMNFLSPIVPQISAIPGFDRILDSTGGQYEGFNYLGAGILLLVLGTLIFKPKSVIVVLYSNPILAIVLVGLFLYSISDKIYIGNYFIADLHYSNAPIFRTLTSVFRADGRFFWPVGYFIAISAIILWIKFLPLRLSAIIIISVLFIQLIDVYPLIKYVESHTIAEPSFKGRSGLMDAAMSHSEFLIYPKYFCTSSQQLQNNILQLQLIAVRAGIPANSAYLDRVTESIDCNADKQRLLDNIASNATTQNPLVVMIKDDAPKGIALTHALAGFSCRDTADLIVCSRKINDPAFVALGPEADLRPDILPLDKKLSIGMNGDAVPYLGPGWSSTEEQLRWAEGPETSILGRFDKPICSALTFDALIKPLSFKNYAVQRAEVALNGIHIGEIVLSQLDQQVIHFDIPFDGHCIQDINFTLHFHDLKSPSELGMNDDTRKLSWLFTWWGFNVQQGGNEEAANAAAIVPVTPPANNSGDFSIGKDTDLFNKFFLKDGWSQPEQPFVWMDKSEAHLLLNIGKGFSGTLSFDVASFLPHPDSVQNASIYINDVLASHVKFSAQNNRQRVVIPLKKLKQDAVDVKFADHDIMSPKTTGISEDARTLGVQLWGLSIQKQE